MNEFEKIDLSGQVPGDLICAECAAPLVTGSFATITSIT